LAGSTAAVYAGRTRYAGDPPLADYFRDGSAEIVTATSRDGLRWSAPAVVSPAAEDGRY
jgi:hypothetical protein